MTKVLLSNRNSVWGVIINPQSSNTYRHVLSFDTPELKDAFINKELFGGQDYKVLIEQQPETKFVQQTSINAVWRINPDDYNETTANLLNKDFAIVKENGKFIYYAITSAKKIAPKTIEFTGELDIFFQYDVKEMFNDKPVMIERAMIDRFFKDQDGDLIPIHQSDHANEDDLTDPILFPEPFELDNANLVPTQYEEMRENLDSYILNLNTLTTLEKEMINQAILKHKWMVLYRSIDKAGHLPNTSGHNSKNNVMYSYLLSDNQYIQYLPYSVLVAPIELNEEEGWVDNTRYKVKYYFNNDGTLNVTNDDALSSFSKPHLEEADVISNTFTITPFSIINFFTPDELKIRLDKTTKTIQVIIKTPLDYYVHKKVKPIVYAYHNQGDDQQAEKMLCLRGINRELDWLPISKEFSLIKPLPNFSNLSINTKVKEIDYRNELKSYFAPFRNIVLKGMSNLEKNLNPQLINDYRIRLKYMYSYIPELWNSVIIPLNYHNQLYRDEDNNSEIPTNIVNFYEDIAPYGLPTEKNAYQEYITAHKSQMTAGLWNNVPQTMLGVAGGMVTGNPLAIAGSISGAISNINMCFALQKDLKRQPLQLSNISSTLVRDISFKNMTPSLTEMVLPPYMMTHIRQFFYTWGYAMNMYQDNINKYLNSRYYFNFLQVPQTFENNKLQASATIKQIINDSFAEGITIWNVRDLATFKGIKNYEYENVEMNLISSPSPAPKGEENAEKK